jgi:hypothetical protein
VRRRRSEQGGSAALFFSYSLTSENDGSRATLNEIRSKILANAEQSKGVLKHRRRERRLGNIRTCLIG